MSPADGPLAPAGGTGGLSARVAGRLARHVPRDAALCVAYSGGLDSTVLLDVLCDVARAQAWTVRAVHVHHGLSPNADAWARHCEAECARRGIPLAVERVAVDRDSPLGLEAAAREARYRVFATREEPYVVLAQHLDDQAETVLLQVLRGTGLKGAAAMPERRALGDVTLLRPLLAEPREALRAHAREQGLAWVEDESNATTVQDRNYLRHAVAPLLDARFGPWREAAARFARHAASADALLETLARLDGVPEAAGSPLRLEPGLAPERRANAIRAYLALHRVPMPGETQLAEMARQLYEARGDARIALGHAGIVLSRHRGEAHLRGAQAQPRDWRVPWRQEPRLQLGAGRGEVAFERVRGAGIACHRLAGRECYFAPRSGGERVRLASRGRSRTLKNLLQECDVPAWERNALPLLFAGEALVWVPGVGIAAEFACGPGEEGLRPSWTVAGKAPLC